MKYKDIKKLAIQSFTKNDLDQKRVTLIAKHLKRSDMKKYIKALKLIEKKNTIYLVLPNEKIKDGINYITELLKKRYSTRKIEFLYDESLIAGIKIINDDLIYEHSMGNTINNLITYLKEENYD